MKKWENELKSKWLKNTLKILTIPGHKRNANQNHIKIPPHFPVRIAVIKNTINNQSWQDCGGKKETSYTDDGNVS
jgi:hypothetical protein